MSDRYMLHTDDLGIWEGKESPNNRPLSYLIRWDEIFRIHFTRSEGEWLRDRTLILDYENGHFVEISDSREGWDEVVGVLDQHLPIQDSSWRTRIEDCESEQIVTIYVNDEMFKPDSVRVLLVDEAPEGDGTFFYQADSARFKRVKEAFITSFGDEVPDDDWEFLYYLRDKGFFLASLVRHSIEGTLRSERESLKEQGAGRLAAYLADHRPSYVICIQPEIADHVRLAVNSSNVKVSGSYEITSGDWKHALFAKELARVLSAIY